MLPKKHRKTHFSDKEVQEVVRNAALIEGRVLSQTSLDDLKAIAMELGISEDAVRSAIEELETGSDVRKARPFWKLPAAYCGVGVAIGALTTGVIPSNSASLPLSSSLLGIGLTGLVSAAIMFIHSKPSRKQRLVDFLSRNAGLWLGFLAVSLWIGSGANQLPEHREMVGGFLVAVAAAACGSALLGGYISSIGSDEGGSNSGGASVRVKTQIAKMLKRMVEAFYARGSIGRAAAQSA